MNIQPLGSFVCTMGLHASFTDLMFICVSFMHHMCKWRCEDPMVLDKKFIREEMVNHYID